MIPNMSLLGYRRVALLLTGALVGEAVVHETVVPVVVAFVFWAVGTAWDRRERRRVFGRGVGAESSKEAQ